MKTDFSYNNNFSYNNKSYNNFDHMLKGIWECELRKVDNPEKEIHELPGLENVSRADVEDIAAIICFDALDLDALLSYDGQYHALVEFPDQVRTKEEIEKDLVEKFYELTGIEI